MRTTLNANRWLWVIPLLLLAALLAGRRLNSLTFTEDETWTLIYVGARSFGPYTPAQALEAEQLVSSDQAFGWTLLINQWVHVAGWSTVAVRALPFLFGLLALAMVYRVGCGLFNHAVAINAALLLTSSVFFLQYFHIARAFTLVALFATLTLWGYWRVALRARPADRTARASLLLGGVGLLYSHYFASLLLPALGLFHLLFVRKDRRWWRTLLIFVLVGLSALPELVSVFNGMEHNLRRHGASGVAMNPPEASLRLLQILTNGLVELPQRTGPVVFFLFLLLLVLSIVLVWRRARNEAFVPAAWFLGVTSLMFVVMVLAANEVVPVLFHIRVRYFIALWPPAALLAGRGIWQLGHRWQRQADWLLACVVTTGIILFVQAQFFLSLDYHEASTVHLADQALVQQAQAEDLLLLEEAVMTMYPIINQVIREYYLKVWEYPREIITLAGEHEQALTQAQAHERVWLLVTEPDSEIERALAEGMVFCQRPVKRDGTVLTLYARSKTDCG